jgi:hypothetical protein
MKANPALKVPVLIFKDEILSLFILIVDIIPELVDNNCRVVARLALPDHNAPPSAGCGDHILITK